MTTRHQPRIKTVVLDFDGVILESAEIKTECYREMTAKFGKAEQKEFLAYHAAHTGLSRHIKFRHLWEEILDRAPSRMAVEKLAEEFAVRVKKSVFFAPFVPGAREFLEAAHAALPLHLLSGTPQEELAEIVAHRELGRYFRSVTGAPTTKPLRLDQLLIEEDCLPGELVFVGDGTSDLAAAKATGVRFLGRLTPENREEFQKSGIETIEDLRELGGIVLPLP